MSGVPPISGLDSNATRYCANIASVNLSASGNNIAAVSFANLHQECETSIAYIICSTSFTPALLPALAARSVVDKLNQKRGSLTVQATANLALDAYTKICRYAYHLPATPYSDPSLAAIIQNNVRASNLTSLPVTAAIDAACSAYLTFGCGRIPQLKPKESPEPVTKEVKEDHHFWDTSLIALGLSALYQGAKYIGKRAGSAAIGGPAGAILGIVLTLGDLWDITSN